MTKERLTEIWQAVAVNAFYDVGQADSTITHEEMIELLRLAKRGLNESR